MVPEHPAKGWIIIYTKFQQIVINECIKQGIIHEASVISDHSKTVFKEFKRLKNYSWLGARVTKFLLLIYFRFFYNRIIKTHELEYIAIPHTEGIISNFLFQKRRKLCIPFWLFYEGILSFYKFNRKGFQRPMPFKRFQSRLLMFRFIKYRNIYPFADPNVQYMLLPEKNVSVGSVKKKIIFDLSFLQIPFESINFGEALILGTPLYGHNISERKAIFKAMAEYLKNKHVRKIFYKPHPNEHNINTEIIYTYFNIEMIDSPNPVEEIFKQISPEYIISTTSSSTLNIKFANPFITAVSFWVTNKLNENSKQVYEIFNKAGIITIDVD